MAPVTGVIIRKAAPPGQRWVTVKDPTHPAFGLPVLVQDRRGGGSTILAGGGPGTQHLRMYREEAREVTPEQQRSQEQFRAARQHNRQIRAAVREQNLLADEAIADHLGIEVDVSGQEYAEWTAAYGAKAAEAGKTAEWATKAAARRLADIRRERAKAFTQMRHELQDQADRILSAGDPEAEIAALEEEVRVVPLPGKRIVVPDSELADDMDPEEFRDWLTRDPGAPVTPDDMAAREAIRRAQEEAAAAEETEGEPEEQPLVPKKRPTHTRIGSQEEALEIHRLLRARREAGRQLRRELVQLPDVPDPGSVASLRRFQVEMEQVSEETLEEVRAHYLDTLEKRVRTALAQALVTSVDRQWDTKAWRGYNIHDAMIRGATDALIGMSNKFVGSAFVDRRVVEGLGIQASAQIVASRIIEIHTRDEARDILHRLTKFHDEVCPDIARDALHRAAALRRQMETFDAQIDQPITDADGKVIASSLLDKTTGEAMNARSMKALLQHLGTAAASLETSAAVIHTLRDFLSGGRAYKTLAMRFVGDHMESAEEKAYAAAKRVGLRKGGYEIRKHADRSATLQTTSTHIKRYLRAMTTEAEAQEALEQVAREAIALPEDWRPPFFKETLAEGQPYRMRPQQLRASEFMLRRIRPEGGGGMVALGVGGGKTHIGFAWGGHLLERNLARRILYIAPDTALQKQVVDEAGRFIDLPVTSIRGGARRNIDQIRARYMDVEQLSVISLANVARDIERMRELGYDPANFFNALGYDAMIVDEAHRLTNLSGGGKMGRAIRRLKPKYRLAMTGTPLRKNPVEVLDVVKWTNPGEFPSRAALMRQYGDMGIGTNAWHDAVALDIQRMLKPYVWSAEAALEAQANRFRHTITTSGDQRQRLGTIEAERQQRRAQAQTTHKDMAERRKAYRAIDTWRNTQRYEVLHNREWQTNALMGRVREAIDSRIQANAGEKFLVFCDGRAGNAALNTVEDMITELGFGECVRLATSSRQGTSISKRAVSRNKAKFQEVETIRFGLCSDANALGHNLQRGDTIIHLDLPETAAHEHQRNGRALRVGREEDVDIVRIGYEDVPEETEALRNLEIYERRLAAVMGTTEGRAEA